MERIGVITDFDNTLVQQMVFVMNHLVITASTMDVRIPEREEILEILKTNPPFESIFDRLFGDKGPDVLAKYRETAMDTPYLSIPGGIEAVGMLKSRGCILVIVSNRTNKLPERLTQAKYDPSDFLAIIQPSSPKPSQDAYKEALSLLETEGIERSNIFIVGDSPDDRRACPDDLIDNFYAVTSGPNPKEDFTKLGVTDDHILNSIAELPPKILTNGRD